MSRPIAHCTVLQSNETPENMAFLQAIKTEHCVFICVGLSLESSGLSFGLVFKNCTVQIHHSSTLQI